MLRLRIVTGVLLFLVLAWIGFELRGLRLAQERWNAAVFRAPTGGAANAGRAETALQREQRREREYQELQRFTDDLAWMVERPMRDKAKPR